MPIGSYPAGSYPAGYGDLSTTARALRTIGTAPKFDTYHRIYTLTPDKSVEQIDVVMHRVAHLLGIPLGNLRSSPGDGFDVEAIRQSTRENAQHTAEDAVNRALKPLLDAGDIEVARVLAIVSPKWLGQIKTDVKNLRVRNGPAVTFRTAT